MSDNFLMKPKVDFAFKEIMANDKARLGFLSAVLHIEPKEIEQTSILNTYLHKEYADDKQGILDVRVGLKNGTEIDIEIQISELKVWPARSIFYISKMYTEQIKPGDGYDVLRKCVNISVLDFNLLKDKEFYSCFHLREDTRHTLYTDIIEFHIIELPKLPAEIVESGNTVLAWAKFINAERKEDFEMLSKESPYIASAYQRLQVISQDADKRAEYDTRLKAQLDYLQGLKEAEERGEARGVAKGREEGEAKGRAEGEAKGRAEGEAIGIAKGREEGIAKGRAEGEAIGIAKGIKQLLQTMLESKPIEEVAATVKMSVEDVKKVLQGA